MNERSDGDGRLPLKAISTDDASGYFETRFKPNPLRERVWFHVTRYLEPFWGLPPGGTALELGAGYGSWIRWVRARERHALDVHPQLADLLEQNGVTGVVPHQGSCVDLSRWAPGTFDLVLASNLLEHLDLEDVAVCLKEIGRVLRPGGVMCVVQPNFRLCPHKYFDDYTHKTIFTDVSLADMISASGFVVTSRWRRFLPFTMTGHGPGLSFLVPIYLRSPIKPLAGQMCIVAKTPAQAVA